MRISSKSSFHYPAVRNVSTECKPFHILGIETSCDDTACAVVSSDKRILSDVRQSQESTHTLLGGVIPTVARDLHAKHIQRVASEAVRQSGLPFNELSAIAVTVKPGLSLSLRIGVKHAVELSVANNLPIIPIHHMEAHALTARLTDTVDLPYLLLLASGGHCLLASADGVTDYKLIGRSMDISPGEALDKIARRLRLRNVPALASMSGGRQIELCATKYEEYLIGKHLRVQRGDQQDSTKTQNVIEVDPEALQSRLFPVSSRPLARTGGCMFSFGGMLSSFRRFIAEQETEWRIEGDALLPNMDAVCYAVQYTIVKHLLTRIQRAFVYFDSKPNPATAIDPKQLEQVSNRKRTLVLSGGVASNSYLRRCLDSLCRTNGYRLVCPPPNLCTDNGVMIAWNGVEKWRAMGPACSIAAHHANQVFDLVQAKTPFGVDLCDAVSRSKISAPQLHLPKLVRSLHQGSKS